MPKQRRHKPGKYKQEQEAESGFIPDFSDGKPYALFQANNGLWGMRDGCGEIVIEPEYHRAEQTDWEQAHNAIRLVSKNTVLIVTPGGWDIVAWISEEMIDKP